MKVQKLAFVRQVTKFRELLQSLDSRENSKSKIKASGKTFSKSSDAWYENVEKSTAKTAIPIIAEVHGVVTELKDVVRKCARREATKLVFARIESKAGVTDANRFIILEADLKKMTNKNGKFVPYRFFLFSDLLVYAHHGFTSYKVHLQVQLDVTTVNGIVAGDETGCCFSVSNPLKSFIVSCSTVAEKQQWYCAIKEASEAAIARKSGQRLAMLKRMQSQEIEVSERQQMHSSRISSPNAGTSGGGGDVPKRRGSDSYLKEGGAPQVVEVPKGLAQHRKPLPNISAAVNDMSHEDEGDEEESGDAFERTPVEQCSDYITALDKRDSSRVFISALKFWKGQLEIENGMSPDVKLKLYGLYKTAKDGSAPPLNAPTALGKAKPRGSVVLTLHTSSTDSESESPADSAETVAARQLGAWRDCGDMSSMEAMRTFVVTLFTVHPQWDYRLR